MTHIVPLQIAELIPSPQAILKQMGIPKESIIQDSLLRMVDDAIELFSEYAQPAGILAETSISEFATIYKGQGKNAEDTPLQHIFTKADYLALFTSTLGARISNSKKIFNGPEP